MKVFKKYMLILAAIPMLWACSADEGSMPGSDPNPAVTVYAYSSTEGNPDNDVKIRFVTNNKTTSVKYIIVPSSDLKDLDNSKLLSKVETEGKTVENLTSNSYADVIVTDLHGEYTIAAVANGKTLGNRATFLGLDWEVVKEGTFYYGAVGGAIAPSAAVEASLEVCTTDSKLYRVNGVFGADTALKMEILDVTNRDEGGVYNMFRVKPTATPWEYEDYGIVSVRDIGYWQNNEAFATNPSYCCGMYKNYNAFFCLQWYVAAGSLGYNYSEFVPYD